MNVHIPHFDPEVNAADQSAVDWYGLEDQILTAIENRELKKLASLLLNHPNGASLARRDVRTCKLALRLGDPSAQYHALCDISMRVLAMSDA